MPDAKLRVFGIHTHQGRVVYDRTKRLWTFKKAGQILLKLSENIDEAELRRPENAGHVRALRVLSNNLYHYVFDLFEIPPHVSERETKRLLRRSLDNFIDMTGYFFEYIGAPRPAGILIRSVGKILNRAVEFVFTGSTEF